MGGAGVMSEGNVVFLDFERAKRNGTEQPRIKIDPTDLARLNAGLIRLKAECEIVLGSLLRKRLGHSF